MTEVEKLKALLAEARESLFDLGERSAFAYERGDRWSVKDAEREKEELHARIDAALAEPVEECANCEIEIKARCLAQQERDEARAEIASLKAELSPMLLAVATSTDERDIARAKAEMAYQRGAEAMREKAATAVLTRFHLSSVTLAKSIRALPLPEDKP